MLERLKAFCKYWSSRKEAPVPRDVVKVITKKQVKRKAVPVNGKK